MLTVTDGKLMLGTTAIGAPFTLTDPHGKRVSLADFRGKVVLLYFGYTYCPDVCPTDLLVIAQSLKSLGKDGEQVQRDRAQHRPAPPDEAQTREQRVERLRLVTHGSCCAAMPWRFIPASLR